MIKTLLIEQQVLNTLLWMKPLFIESGISEKRFTKSTIDLQTINRTNIKKLEKIILRIKDDSHKSAKEIKDLLPDHIWEGYKQMELYNLREQVLLRERLKELKKDYLNIEFFIHSHKEKENEKATKSNKPTKSTS